MSRKKQAPAVAYPEAAQADLTAGDGTCPTCGRAWDKKAAVKVCRRCGRVVNPGERWHMVAAGPGLVAIEHRDCDQRGRCTSWNEHTRCTLEIGHEGTHRAGGRRGREWSTATA